MDGWANALLSQWLGGNNSGPRRAGCKRGSGRRGRRQTSSDYSGPSAGGQVRSGGCAGASRPALRRWHECRRQGSPVTICCAWSPPGWVMRFHVINEEKLMFGKQSRWIAPLAATAAVLLTASPAGAATVTRPPTPGPIVIPAELSCGDFALRLSATGGKITQIAFDNGNLFKVGKGVILTWTNVTSGKTYTVNTVRIHEQVHQEPGRNLYVQRHRPQRLCLLPVGQAGGCRGLPVHRAVAAHG